MDIDFQLDNANKDAKMDMSINGVLNVGGCYGSVPTCMSLIEEINLTVLFFVQG